MSTPISRRAVIRRTAATAAFFAATSSLHSRLSAANTASGRKGRINHSVCKWCYPKISLDDLCVAGKQMGLKGTSENCFSELS